MAGGRDEQLPESLERQLRRLEQIGNAEAELYEEERWLRARGVKAKRPAVKRFSSPATHDSYTRELRLQRESARTRKLAVVLLCLAPVFSLGYVVSGFYQRSVLALAFMLAAGFALGLAIVGLYIANKRLQE